MITTTIQPQFDGATTVRRLSLGLYTVWLRSARLRIAGQWTLMCYVSDLNDLSRNAVESKSNRSCNHRIFFSKCDPVFLLASLLLRPM